MPTDYSTTSTTDLLALLASTQKGQTWNAIMSEITTYRIIPNDYPVEEMRGGVRPYRPNL